jgi:hypothetical protein
VGLPAAFKRNFATLVDVSDCARLSVCIGAGLCDANFTTSSERQRNHKQSRLHTFTPNCLQFFFLFFFKYVMKEALLSNERSNSAQLFVIRRRRPSNSRDVIRLWRSISHHTHWPCVSLNQRIGVSEPFRAATHTSCSLIAGNPGVCEFYYDFADALHRQLSENAEIIRCVASGSLRSLHWRAKRSRSTSRSCTSVTCCVLSRRIGRFRTCFS